MSHCNIVNNDIISSTETSHVPKKKRKSSKVKGGKGSDKFGNDLGKELKLTKTPSPEPTCMRLMMVLLT